MAQVLTQVTNTHTNTVTTFGGYAFNSMVAFQGLYLGAGDDGLFQLDDDASVEMPVANVATGDLHFNSEMQKRISDFFISMRADGDITLRVYVDESLAYEYLLSPLDIETIKQRRSLIGKGLKGKYWRFELENSGGDHFEFDAFNVAAVLLGRRL